MSLNFLLGLGSLAYLSTQGHKKKRHSASAVPSRFGTGDRAYANSEKIRRDYLSEARSVIHNWRGMSGGCYDDYSDADYPAGIWGWRCYDIERKYTIWAYAGANKCTINELCARYGQAEIYLKYGIENYSGFTTSKIWIENWGHETFEFPLYPHPTNDKLRIDKYGVEWYYISKEDMYDYYLRPAREEHLKMMQRKLFKE